MGSIYIELLIHLLILQSYLRKDRDVIAAKACFRKAFKYNRHPWKVTIDKSGSNIAVLRALNKELAEDKQIEVDQVKYFNNIVEQEHRFIKKQTKLILGFKSVRPAKITISVIENIRIIQKGQIIGSNYKVSTFENFKMLMAA